jgi:hypothetical protein
MGESVLVLSLGVPQLSLIMIMRCGVRKPNTTTQDGSRTLDTLLGALAR